MDMRFNHPSTWIVAGPSMSGKSSITVSILRNKSEMFKNGDSIKKVIYFYSEWQKSFEDLLRDGVVDEFSSQQPTLDLIKSKVEHLKDSGGSIVVLDDKMHDLTKDISSMFSKLSHHNNITIFLLVQNLFFNDQEFRNISLNSKYILLTKNPRDKAQITHFAKQFAPGKGKYVVESYREATKQPYGYLLFDHCQDTPDELRVRSNIFHHEFPMKVWIDSKDNIST